MERCQDIFFLTNMLDVMLDFKNLSLTKYSKIEQNYGTCEFYINSV